MNTETKIDNAQARCGFVALIGAPNAGKSTLLNAMVEHKVAVVSRKAQTTRARSIGIVSSGNSQLLLCDTPGLFQPSDDLGKGMVAAAHSAAARADIVCLIHDARGEVTTQAKEVIAQGAKKTILVLNKIDRVRRQSLLPIAAWAGQQQSIRHVFMISALSGDGVEDLKQHLLASIPQGPWLYDGEQVSDQPLSRLAAEFTREQLYDLCHDELPYSLSVETIAWREQSAGLVRIEQVVYVARKSHKPMVIGAGGSVLKAVGTAVRQQLEAMLQRKVFLAIRVKVHPKWHADTRHLATAGIEQP